MKRESEVRARLAEVEADIARYKREGLDKYDLLPRLARSEANQLRWVLGEPSVVPPR